MFVIYSQQFRAALQMVVSAGDPREDLENFMKIGEGSTGTVCIATYKSTGKSIRNHFRINAISFLTCCFLFEK